MGRTRGEPDEIEWTPIGVELNARIHGAYFPAAQRRRRKQQQRRLPPAHGMARMRAVLCFGWVFFLISSGGQAHHMY